MKIAHCSDWHIGYKAGRKTDELGVNLRLKDGVEAMRAIIDDIIAHEVDAMVVAGDIFHTPFPSPYDIVAVQEQLRKVAQAGIRVYQLAGNHEATDVASDVASSKILDDPLRHIYSHVEPYVRYEITDGVMLHMVSHHQYSRQEETFKDIKPVDGMINLFTTHGSVLDPVTSTVLSTPQSPREIVIPDHLVDQWDYSLLGHIHQRKHVTDNMYYNGSLIRRGFSDKPGDRGWTLFEIKPDGTFELTPKNVFQRPQYDFDVIDTTGLSSAEVTDTIIDRLAKTQTDGFDPVNAPIIRQKLDNATPGLLAGLDEVAITDAAAHTFTWQLQASSAPQQVTPKAESNEIIEAMTMKDYYDAWTTADDKVREKASKYLEQGMETYYEKMTD